MKKIIIRTPNFLGDTINISPCIQLIRHEYPDAQIVIVCPDFIKDVYKYDKNIYKCITFPDAKRHKLSTFWNLWRKLRHEKGDLGILFINTFISALIFKLAGIKCSIGYQRECRGILLDFKIPFNINKHYINRYASLFNEFTGNKYKTLPDLYLPISNNSTFHFNNTNPNIGLYLGGENKSFRKYPDNHIKHQEYIATVRKENIINLSGSTSLEDFFNTIAHLNLLITIDSSAMHIAAALKVPFIALLGLSTSPTSTIIPKVPLGRILKIENNLIREEDYIRNITPDLILKTVSELI